MDLDIQIGDLITTRKWVGPKFLEFSHSAIVIDLPTWSKDHDAYIVKVVDYLYDGCKISHLLNNGKGKNTIRVVRLKKNVPNRDLIINMVVKIALKATKLPNADYCFVPRQFIRVLLRKCFVKDPNFQEAKKYYEAFFQ